jgi:hypothetical protein
MLFRTFIDEEIFCLVLHLLEYRHFGVARLRCPRAAAAAAAL